MRPADHSKFGEENGHDSLSVNELLALHDPNFLDMYEWLTSSTQNDLDRQHYPHFPQTLSAPIAEVSSTVHNTAAVEEDDHDIVEIIATTPLEKSSLSSSSPEHDQSNDNGRYYPQLFSSPITEVSDAFIDIPAVAKMDVDPPEIAPSPKFSRKDSEVSDTFVDIPAVTKMDVDPPEIAPSPKFSWKDLLASMQLKASTAASKDFMASEDSMVSKDFIDVLGPVGISRSALSSKKLKARMRTGTHTINKARQKTFESECLLSDPHTEFRYGEIWKVFHSRCGKWLTMTEAYNTMRFQQHIKRCTKMDGGIPVTGPIMCINSRF